MYSRYLLTHIYDNAMTMNKIHKRRVLRLCDHFIIAMADIFKNVSYKNKSVNVECKYLNHISFALIEKILEELKKITRTEASIAEGGTRIMNTVKTKFLSLSEEHLLITIRGLKVETVNENVYLRHRIEFGKKNQKAWHYLKICVLS